MSFSFVSPLPWLLGLAVIAGALYLLQRLRVRHEEVPVVTTLFWKEAVAEARARVLIQRFRHPWAFALVLAIAALLWFAVAGPRAPVDAERDHVLLLDGSAGMARAGRFEAAVTALQDDLEALDPDGRAVIWCGATPRTLLLPGEETLLLAARLEGVAPASAPATVEAELMRFAGTQRENPLAVRVYGDAPVRPQVLAALPAGVTVTRAELDSPDAGENRGIVTFGSAPAASGVWSRVDVLALVDGGDASDLSASLDGAPLDAAQVRVIPTADGARVVLSDLPSQGGTLSIGLPGGDALALDDRATLALPRRPPIHVVVSEAAAPALVPVLSLDSAVTLVEPGVPADVVFRLAGEPDGGETPAFELVPGDGQADAFLVTWPGDEQAREALQRVIDALALEEVDATALAEEAGRPISVGVEPGATRGIRVWRELLSPSYDLLESRAFPLLVARSVRWLAGEDETPAWVAVGERALAVEAHAPAGGPALDPAGAAFVPPAEGAYAPASEPDRSLHASLLDAAATAGPAALVGGPLAATALADVGGAGWDLVTWVLLLALGLLGAEWWLHRTGRMP